MDRAEMAVRSAPPGWTTPTPTHAQQYMHIHQCPTSREDSACTHVVMLHVAHHRRRPTGATLWAAAGLQDALFAHRGDEA